ncbi:MAG: hypothetical protein F7B20_03470 [Aeropyrum sp.]|nr:hypothetical protein [Aeropyrum sp.]MCE4615624.1 hypothetical protein [Aeropyrum sp.]
MQGVEWRRLEASRLHRLLCKKVGCPEWGIGEWRTEASASELMSTREDLALSIVKLVYRVRKGGDCCGILGRISEELVGRLPEKESARLRRTPVEPVLEESIRGPSSLAMLIAYARRFSRSPRAESLLDLVSTIVKEASRPCSVDMEVERSVERLESRMKAYGLLLAILVPLYLLGMIVVGLASIIPLGIATVVIWHVVRSDGLRYYRLNVERGWRKCSVREEDLEDIVRGLPPETAAFRELLGVDVRRGLRSS